MNTSQRSNQGWFYGWWVVCASVVGMIVSQGPVLVFTFGIFMKPLGAEFGWTRSQISLALTVAILSAAFFTPWVGRLIDRHGARQVAIPALILFGLGVASLAFLPAHLVVFYLWFCCIGILSAGGTPTAYAKSISHWFVRRRGLALGLSMAGIGLGATLMPIIAQRAVGSLGWRGGFAVIGVVVLIGMLIVALKLRNCPADMGLHPDNETPPSGDRRAAVGLTSRQAMHTRTFWLIAVSFFLAALAINGCAVHFVPMLTDRGVSPQDAARTAAVIGMALIVGRVAAGFLLDYLFAPFVTLFFFSGPVIGILLLYGGATGGEAVLCAALIGLGVGAEVDLIAYLASRYFGLKAFGEVYGYLFAIFCVGTALGPLLMGTGQTLLGSYDLVLLLFVGCMLAACVLICCVGRYPDLSQPESPTAAQGQASSALPS